MKESQSIRGLARLVAGMRAAQEEIAGARWYEDTAAYLAAVGRCQDLEARVDAAVAEVLGRGEE
jgi:outer membrane protein assembly factor BamD (BamD/ComL family)